MRTAIIVAAGRGTRMGPDVDKLFLDVAGAPVIWHTWRRLDHCSSVDSIVVVIREGMHSTFEELAHALDPRKPWVLAVGGKERQDSVWNGLMAVDPKTRLVAVQDGARPCTDNDLIQRCFSAASRVGASVAAQRCTDTVKESEGGTRIARHLDRTRLWTVQTPQCFRIDVLRDALSKVRQSGASVTDDTAACELIGQPVELVESNAPNPKVTSPPDLPWVNLLLQS